MNILNIWNVQVERNACKYSNTLYQKEVWDGGKKETLDNSINISGKYSFISFFELENLSYSDFR